MEAINENEILSEKEIEKELGIDLSNAEIKNDKNQNSAMDMLPAKPRLDLGTTVIKLVCGGKNSIQFRMVTKGLPISVKDKLSHFNTVKDNEVAVYKSALDQYGSEFLPSEMIEMINKYANSPLGPLIEFEIEKFKLMKAEVKLSIAEIKEDEK